MRSKRSHDKYAPVLTEEKYEPEKEEVKYINKPVKKVEWKPHPYTKMLYNHMFARWRA